MLAPDLGAARRAAERLMCDTARITRDAQGPADDTLDQATGALVRPAPDTVTVYDTTTAGNGGRALDGRCLVRPSALSPRELSEGGQVLSATLYDGYIPWDAPLPAIGDVVEMITARWDPSLAGRLLRVKEVQVSSTLIRRQMLLEARS